jgi:hypothetical protein
LAVLPVRWLMFWAKPPVEPAAEIQLKKQQEKRKNAYD